jgi:hypothetical protein
MFKIKFEYAVAFFVTLRKCQLNLTFSFALPACFCTDFASNAPLLSAILPSLNLINWFGFPFLRSLHYFQVDFCAISWVILRTSTVQRCSFAYHLWIILKTSSSLSVSSSAIYTATSVLAFTNAKWPVSTICPLFFKSSTLLNYLVLGHPMGVLPLKCPSQQPCSILFTWTNQCDSHLILNKFWIPFLLKIISTSILSCFPLNFSQKLHIHYFNVTLLFYHQTLYSV